MILQMGDIVSFEGVYRHPRWWQWRRLYRYYRRKDRVRPLKQFVVIWSST